MTPGPLARLVPDGVVVAEAFGDTGAALLPGEEAAVAGAVAERRDEFATTRGLAREALGRLGVAPVAIPPRGEGPAWVARAPRWPDGVVGSLTHCAGYRAAAVARRSAFAALGIDAEPHAPLPAGVADEVVLPGELPTWDGDVMWDRVVFSAKESVFKAWFALTSRWLDFTDCAVRLAPDGTFVATPSVLGPGPFAGRWAVTGGLVLTCCAVR